MGDHIGYTVSMDNQQTRDRLESELTYGLSELYRLGEFRGPEEERCEELLTEIARTCHGKHVEPRAIRGTRGLLSAPGRPMTEAQLCAALDLLRNHVPMLTRLKIRVSLLDPAPTF